MSLMVVLFSAASLAQIHVDPILGDITRHQSDPYNKYCPLYDGKTPVQVGCVATACEMIMTHYGRTITLTEELPGWQTEHLTVASVPAGETVVCDEGDVDAIARLSYWLGVACHMNWRPDASGASIHRLQEPLKKAFGWKYAEHLFTDNYSPSTWRAIINAELQAGRPILYAGYTALLSGHAFVIDGVREDGLYHANWGYGENYTQGWYELSELFFANPDYDRQPTDRFMGFSANQEMLLLHPDEQVNALIADSIQRTGKEVSISMQMPPQGIYAGQYCPFTFTLENTTAEAYTTTYELLSNEVERTDSLFEKGDYALLFTMSLEPYERVSVTVPGKFDEAGQRILRLSSDDVTFAWESAPITIQPAEKANLIFSEPAFLPSNNGVRIAVDVTNKGAAPAGTWLTYCLFEGSSLPDVLDNETRHYNYIYTPAQSTEHLSATFCGLKPDTDYTLLLRQPWTPLFASGHTFRTSADGSGITPITSLPDAPSRLLPLGPTDLLIAPNGKKVLIHHRRY